MSTTNHTLNYELSQYVDSDVTSYLTNYNSDMVKIDEQMKRNADSAQTAIDNSTIAVSTATTAASNASTALSTASSANETAESAQTAAQSAQTASGQAQTDAATALRASASNSITNLAPSYDPTLTYNVGDLVTYIFPDTNHGHLYKCVVAVSTPEDFDVNKWDDVTTSEVYSRPSNTIASVTSDGVKTYSEIFNDLATQAGTFTSDKEYLLKWTTPNSEEYIKHLTRISNNGARAYFSSVTAQLTQSSIQTILMQSTNSTIYEITSNVSDNSVTFNDFSNSATPNGAIFSVIELSTI